MDDQQFDALARTIDTFFSRRRVWQPLAGIAVVASGGLLKASPADAKKKKPCPPCKKRKKGKCKATLPDGAACVGGSCQRGSCVAAAPPPECTTAASCPAPSETQLCAQATCIGGACGIGPKPVNTLCRAAGDCGERAECDGASLDCPVREPKPAGTPCISDNNVCTEDVCNATGTCTHPRMPDGFVCGTNQVCCAGTCRNLQTDERNCGRCTHQCGSGSTCCAGSCRNPQIDEANCGACGHRCGAGETCCSGVCRNLQNDEASCGTCGTVCSGAKRTCCSGVCRNLLTDDDNCMGCGRSCSFLERCCGYTLGYCAVLCIPL